MAVSAVQSNKRGELQDCFAKEENRNIPNLKLLVSTDVLEAFFLGKGRKHKEARAVLVAGRAGALRLWVTPFQIIEMHRKADAVLSDKTLEFEQPYLQQMSCSDLLKITQKKE